MVGLVSERSERELETQQEATRGGLDLVPAVVRAAGAKAVESFLCFFARAKSEHTGYVQRTAANHFFRWCGASGLALEALRAGHVAGFFEAKREEWKPPTTKIYFRSLERLFAHLEADRIVERSPFAGAPKPQGPKVQRQALAKLTEFLRELDGIGEGSESFRPGLVAMYPVVVGGMDVEEIAACVGLPVAEVEVYAGRLRANGIWTPEGKISVSFEDPDSFEAVVELAMQIGCAEGRFERVDLPEAQAAGTERVGE
jgi:hypothetical protein